MPTERSVVFARRPEASRVVQDMRYPVSVLRESPDQVVDHGQGEAFGTTSAVRRPGPVEPPALRGPHPADPTLRGGCVFDAIV